VHGGIAGLLLAGSIAAPSPKPDALPVFEIVIPAAQPQAVPAAEAARHPAEPDSLSEPEPLPKPADPPPVLTPAPKPRPRPPQQTAEPRAEERPAAPGPAAADVSTPAPAPVAGPTLSQPQAPAQEVIPPYAPILLDWLARHRDYPRAARLRRQEGIPQIALVLDRSGRLLALTLVQSSGIPLLDEAALAMAQRAAPFPPPQLPAGSEKASFIVPVRFALER
jgi:protein TonB